MKKTITDNTIDSDILAYTVGEDPALDLALVKWDCMGTAAHVTMLSEMKGLKRPIVTRTEARRVRRELARIVALAEKGEFRIRVEDQDVHMAVERMLTERLGDLGKKIHTGRSRNDQVAVDVRLHMKDEILQTEREIAALAAELCAFGHAAGALPLVGRTHLQPAMPSTVEMWATGHAEMIIDQLANFEAAYALADLNPLGSAAGYGVPLPLDRQRTTELLGFSRTLHNCFGASMARGECEASLLSALAQLMCVLSRLAEDLILFSMPEFAYFRLPREYCTGSSIMPQKFNPDVLELVRGKTAQVIGLETAALTLLHAMPGGYNRDLQDAKPLYMRGLETTRTTLRILAKVIAGTKVDAAACRAAFTPGVFATDVALRMVAEGTPWRDAYHEVRDHLERLENENCDKAVALKKHEGTCLGIDHTLYQRRISSAVASAETRLKTLNARCKALFRSVTAVVVLALAVLQSGCVSADAEQRDDQSLRVAVYMGNGARAAGAFRHLQIASVAEGVNGFPVDAKMIRDGVLDETDVLVMPGGYSVAEAKALGEQGAKRLKSFIWNGGGFLGTCAGCYLLTQCTSSHKNMLGIVPYLSPDEFGSGHADLMVRFTEAATTRLGIQSNTTQRVNYAGGPVLVPGEPVEGADFAVVATYDSDFAKGKRGNMAGKAAMVAGTYGKGRIFLSALHPEKDLDDHYVLRRAIRYLSGRNIGWKIPKKRRGQLSVGVLCDASMGVETARGVQAIIRSEDFDLTPLTTDDIDVGDYRHCDVLLALDTIEPKRGTIGLGKRRAFTERFLARGGRIVAWGAHGKKYAALGQGVTAVNSADEAVAALKAIAAEPAPEIPEWACAPIDHPIRTAVYVDDGGFAPEITEMLELAPEYAVTVVSGADIRNGALKNADLLLMPGGSCQGEAVTLGAKGRAEIERFVRAGGKYYGVCAGAFLASQQKQQSRPRLGLIPWQADNCPSYRGWGNVTLKLTDAGSQVFTGSAKSRNVLYWGGPVMVPGAAVEDSDIEVLATYDWQVMSTSSPNARTSMNGKAAIVGGRVGKGKVFVQCPHPECAEENFDMVLSGFEYLTGVRPTRRQSHKMRGQLVVGYCSVHDAPYGDFYRALVKSRSFYARDVKDRWIENDMSHVDAFVVLEPTAGYFRRRSVKEYLASGRPMIALARTAAQRRAVEKVKGVTVVSSYDAIIPELEKITGK